MNLAKSFTSVHQLHDHDVVIVSAVRPDALAALVIREAVTRAGVAPEQIEKVIPGCFNEAGEDNRNVARLAALLAGLPHEVDGVTVNRLCASGLSAINTAARAIRNGAGKVCVAGAAESMTRGPLSMPKGAQPFANGNVTVYDTTLGWHSFNPAVDARFPLEAMGETAENIVDRSWTGEFAGGEMTREDQDAYALESQRCAVAALNAGVYREESVRIAIRGKRGTTISDTDEHPRSTREGHSFTRATNMDPLADLRPAVRKNGTVIAGNANGLNDGASAVMLVSAGYARELGLKPPARWVGAATAGLDPRVMDLGPVPATRKLLDRLGMSGAREAALIERVEA